MMADNFTTHMPVECLRHWGSDIDVVNNARVSFNRESYAYDNGGISSKDKNLIEYLAMGVSHDERQSAAEYLVDYCGSYEGAKEVLTETQRTAPHFMPFANGIGATFRIKAPIPIMRQLFKHKVGATESEVSRRYVDAEPEFYIPVWRKRAENAKQGSSSETFRPEAMHINVGGVAVTIDIEDVYSLCAEYYDHILSHGVAPEQARFVLPQGMMTEAIISNSLYGWASLYNKRSDRNHAQSEVADIADEIGSTMQFLFPISWKALTQ